MNLRHAPARIVSERVPHARGDEPPRAQILADGGDVFPTPVGMNRS